VREGLGIKKEAKTGNSVGKGAKSRRKKLTRKGTMGRGKRGEARLENFHLKEKGRKFAWRDMKT
jgi:hypothetical protein